MATLLAKAVKLLSVQDGNFSACFRRHPDGPVCEVRLFSNSDACAIAFAGNALILDHEPLWEGGTSLHWDAHQTAMLFSDMVITRHKCTYLQWKKRWMASKVACTIGGD